MNRRYQNRFFSRPRDGGRRRREGRKEKETNYQLVTHHIYETSSLGDKSLICRSPYPETCKIPNAFQGLFETQFEAIFIHDKAHQREAWATCQIKWRFPFNISTVNI